MSRFEMLSHTIWHCQYHNCIGSKISAKNIDDNETNRKVVGAIKENEKTKHIHP